MDLMSEQGDGEPEFLPVGERLKRAREARGMSLDDVATQTRIPIRHLQHIESGDWEALPATTYAIGFTRNYANAVGLDGPALGNELRDSIGGPRRRAPPPEYYEPADPARVPPRSLAIAAVILVAVLIAVYMLWRGAAVEDPTSIPVTEAPQAGAPAAPAAPPPRAAAGQSVTLTATGEVWLRVTDAEGGGQLFSGNLNRGQSFTIPAGARRPVVRTGRPQLLRATVGGRDLGPLGPEERTVTNLSLLPQDIAGRNQGAAATPTPAPAPPADQPAAPLTIPTPQ
jgi:cytoskeletal protein RodZ